jgi:hypothetical protein
MRKGLLGDLSSLVKTAKTLQETLQTSDTAVPVYEYMDDLVLKSFKLVTRAVRFLDIGRLMQCRYHHLSWVIQAFRDH